MVAARQGQSGREVAGRLAGLRAWARRHAFSLLSSLGTIARHPLASLMTFGVLAFALALPLALHVALTNLERLSQQWERLDTVSVFLQPGLEPAEVDRLVSRWSTWPQVLAVDPISPDQGLAELSLQLGLSDAAGLLEDNPLPWVLEITPASGFQRETLLARVEAEPGVSSVVIDLQWLERLDAMTEVLSRLVLLLAALLALGVAVIIGNTIRLDIQNRREEIEVMALVGATPSFIRRPFLYTGLWYGLIGGVLAWLLVAGALLALDEPFRALSRTYAETAGLLHPDFETMLLVFGGSSLFGLLGSWLVVAQHLRRIDC
ncbi:MAG: permease-like cell division protein FtsX [Wenzhouxiangella sp.]